MDLWQFIGETAAGAIVSEIILVALGLFFANFIKARYDDWRHGGWEIKVVRNNKELVRRKISPRKKKEIFEDEADMSVYTKGVASPYAHINCDIVEEGVKRELLVIEKPFKWITINLDHNPPDERQNRSTL